MGSRDCAGNTEFGIGVGIHDITGPVRGREMMGYVMLVPPQMTCGIHMRLRSRAFVIESSCNNKRLVFVSADLGMIFQAVSLAVLKRLEERFGDRYTAENVILSATHTHSGPGGYSHYFLYEAISLGFDSQNFNAIVDGIFQSIVKAHENLTPGSIAVAEGDLSGSSRNRSPEAYAKNVDTEEYEWDVDRRMTVLKLSAADGKVIGIINWFAVHGTSLDRDNKLISGDNKGYASYLFEKAMGTDYEADKPFVAAFAQSNEGDVSPNVFGPDNGGRFKNPFESLKESAARQYEMASNLLGQASEPLVGAIDFRHTYVDFSAVRVEPQWTDGQSEQMTAPSALGVAKLAGTEDGRGIPFVKEGITTQNIRLYDNVAGFLVRLLAISAVKVLLLLRPGRTNRLRRHLARSIALRPKGARGQGVKPVLVNMGIKRPEPWTPPILPVQVARIGSLAIIAAPFECTTMAGRRLRSLVEAKLKSEGVTHCVIAGLANAYGGYLTTPEEYLAQHYEGASTEFGPWQLGALRQTVSALAESLAKGTAVYPGPRPHELSGDTFDVGLGPRRDIAPPFRHLGDVHRDARPQYKRNDVVKVSFWGGNPNNDLKTQSTYLKVLKRIGDSWIPIARDWDPETRFISRRWKPFTPFSESIVEWHIPTDQEPGVYQIVHDGNGVSGSGAMFAYCGKSRPFVVLA